MVKLDSFEHEITSWAGVTVHAHRFGGREFRFRSAELGHIHENGTLDIPFPRLIGNFLIRENLAEEHAWVPNSGWTTFRLRGQQDFQHALWLMRLSYLRYELKAAKACRALAGRGRQPTPSQSGLAFVASSFDTLNFQISLSGQHSTKPRNKIHYAPLRV